MDKNEAVHVAVSRGIPVDVSDAKGRSVFCGDMPQVPAVGETFWIASGDRYVVRGVEWNVDRDRNISADVMVEIVNQ